MRERGCRYKNKPGYTDLVCSTEIFATETFLHRRQKKTARDFLNVCYSEIFVKPMFAQLKVLLFFRKCGSSWHSRAPLGTRGQLIYAVTTKCAFGTIFKMVCGSFFLDMLCVPVENGCFSTLTHLCFKRYRLSISYCFIGTMIPTATRSSKLCCQCRHCQNMGTPYMCWKK